jgi:hypothetical protein
MIEYGKSDNMRKSWKSSFVIDDSLARVRKKYAAGKKQRGIVFLQTFNDKISSNLSSMQYLLVTSKRSWYFQPPETLFQKN